MADRAASAGAGLLSSRLTVDGGQTGIRLRLRTADGSLVVAERSGVRADWRVMQQVVDAVQSFAASTGEQFEGLAVGLSGLTPESIRPAELLDAVAASGLRRVALAHDSVSGYLAANGLAPGAVIAVGTGVVALGVGGDRAARVDGWGHLFGDAGSAFWIGRAGIEAALRAFDGRAPATALLGALERRWGSAAEVPTLLQGAPDRVATTASFAREVAAAATDGDGVARAIELGAGAELAATAAAALGVVGTAAGAPTRVSWVGRVLTANDRVRLAFTDRLATLVPGAVVEPPLGESLDGAERLLDVPRGHPLRSSIATATS